MPKKHTAKPLKAPQLRRALSESAITGIKTAVAGVQSLYDFTCRDHRSHADEVMCDTLLEALDRLRRCGFPIIARIETYARSTK